MGDVKEVEVISRRKSSDHLILTMKGERKMNEVRKEYIEFSKKLIKEAESRLSGKVLSENDIFIISMADKAGEFLCSTNVAITSTEK